MANKVKQTQMKKKSLFDNLCQDHTLFCAWKAVKEKGASGGIDGMSIDLFDAQLDTHLKKLKQELISKTWQPEPYLRISIPKKNKERRMLGLLCIKDKIVQQAIKRLIEPRFEKTFVSNSYGYRPGKGHSKAVRFAKFCCQNKTYPYVLRLDIDNYFDTIDHELLFRRVYPLIADDEIFRLVQLCVKMGMVNKQMKWNEITQGVPQGAVLSPLLANHYLHSFDQFVLSRTKMYVRYADDFIILCKSREEAEILLTECSTFLEERLKLKLNAPVISEVKDGIEFLGIRIDNRNLSLSAEKKEKLTARIQSEEWSGRSFCEKGLDALKGILNYYVPLLPQNYLTELDETLLCHLKKLIQEHWQEIPNKSTLQTALKVIPFFAEENILKKSQLKTELINCYLLAQSKETKQKNELKNKRLIAQRKKEYRQKENEASELIVSSYGTFIGVNNKGITVKTMGKKQTLPTTSNLQHITVLSDGVSISSNALAYCMQKRIGIDFFNATGKHTGSFLSAAFMQTSLWTKQANLPLENKSKLATNIIIGKIRNQMNLIKYFHKYHKESSETLKQKYSEILPKLKILLAEIKATAGPEENYATKLTNMEAKGAELYWGYIRELIQDDGACFTHRERHGATDLVNCMLNYGYAILYARIWQAILHRKMNPTQSVIHAPQPGKPTFVYDVIELFRTQAVDRVVISLIQKKEPLKVQQGMLDRDTKRRLVQNLAERINRYEKYRGNECRFCDIIRLQVKEIADYIEKGIPYKPYIAKW